MRKVKIALGVIVAIVSIVLIAFIVRETSIQIELYSAQIDIDNSGNMIIEETWVIDYPADYKVRFRDISYYKNHRMNPLTKDLDTENDKASFDTNPGQYSVHVIDDMGVYIENGIRKGYSFKGDYDELGKPVECYAGDYMCESIFVDLSEKGGFNGKTTFEYHYVINGAVTQYDDISELNWVLFDYAETTVQEATVSIHLPSNSFDKEEIMVWGHGARKGDIYIEDSQNISMTIKDITTSELLEIRVAFPNELVPNINERNVVKGALKNKIIDYETKLSEETNKQLQIIRVINALTVVIVFATLGLAIYAYKRFDKEYKPMFNEEYLREPPVDLKPAEVSYLWNFGKAKDEDVTATLLDLVRRKILNLKDQGVDINNDDPDFEIELNKEADLSTLELHEKILIDYFINTIGDKEKVTIKQIENYGAKSYSAAQKVVSELDRFKKAIKSQYKNKKYFENAKEKAFSKGGALGLVHVVMIIVIIALGIRYNIVPGVNLIIVGACFALYMGYLLTIKRRTRAGNEEYHKWKAFKKFLEDFSEFKDYPMPGIVIWEKYLVYATVFGIADKVMKQLKVKLPEDALGEMDPGVTYMRGYYYGRRHSFIVYNSISNSYRRSYTNSLSTIASYQASSGSGRGGGFSGGRSFGGGGGGGRSR